MTPEELKNRTKVFAVRVIRFAEGLANGRSSDVITRQLVKAATSVGANYRAACVGRSRAEFNAKLQIVLEEADESVYWLEVLNESGLAEGGTLEELKCEGKELAAIVMASLKPLAIYTTAKRSQFSVISFSDVQFLNVQYSAPIV